MKNNKKLPILLDKFKTSKWAFYYCRDINNDPEIRKLITYSGWAYSYCRDINNDPEIRKYITDSFWAYHYCIDINDDPEVRKYITNKGLLNVLNYKFKEVIYE